MTDYINAFMDSGDRELQKQHLFALLTERNLLAASFVSSVWNNPPKGKEAAYKAREMVAFDRTMDRLHTGMKKCS